jgi:hypothetical protein
MPRLPIEVLKKAAASLNRMVRKVDKKEIKNKFLIFSFLLIIGIELASTFLVNAKSYLLVIYPILTQLVMFIATFTMALYSKRLRFCERKELALYLVSAYYLLNVFFVLFPSTNYIYSIIVNLMIMGIAVYLLITEIKK